MIGWLDCWAGVSGDMLLGALVDVGVPLELLQRAVDAVGVEPVRLRTEPVQRAGIGALRVHVQTAPVGAHRTWETIRGLLGHADLDASVRTTALAVFERLAAAEGAVHRVPPSQVRFHEVGALDAIADIVAVAAGFHALRLTALSASPVSVGSGSTRGAHGPLPVPAPAVLALLDGAPVQAGPVPHESATPTGAALLAELVTSWSPLPQMTLDRVGVGAGGRDPAQASNVLRLVLGQPTAAAAAGDVLLETNVDDLDPRIWPGVLDRLLAAGASDAWLTPIVMKKGRPAYTLSVLCPAPALAALRRVVFEHTSSIGLRAQPVVKTALERIEDVIRVDGMAIRVKRAMLDGAVVNSQAEWEDVAAASLALDKPAKQILARALGAAYEKPEGPPC